MIRQSDGVRADNRKVLTLTPNYTGTRPGEPTLLESIGNSIVGALRSLGEAEVTNAQPSLAAGAYINHTIQSVGSQFVQGPMLHEYLSESLDGLTRIPNDLGELGKDIWTDPLHGLGELSEGLVPGLTASDFAMISQTARATTAGLGAIEMSSAAELARAAQVGGGYAADAWTPTSLKAGQIVYGGLGGQSAYYTDYATLQGADMAQGPLWDSLQVKPDPYYGPRGEIGVYEVVSDTDAAASQALANTTYGSGGGTQYFIPNYQTQLRLLHVIPLTH